jgi:hypothetical protein
MIYLLSIVVVAVLFGLGTDMLLQSLAWSGSVNIEHGCPSGFGVVSWASAVGLTLLMMNGLRARIRNPKPPASGEEQI